MELLTIGIVSYLMGSIPFGLILTKIFLNKQDNSKTSSNNPKSASWHNINTAFMIQNVSMAIASS